MAWLDYRFFFTTFAVFFGAGFRADFATGFFTGFFCALGVSREMPSCFTSAPQHRANAAGHLDVEHLLLDRAP